MNNYIILRRNAWSDSEALERAAGRASQVGSQRMADQLRWIRSYVIQETPGSLGTVCVYQAIDAGALREHARRAELPCDEVMPVIRTVVINEDPVERR